ncbi:urease accessory protein [Halospina denitrificans]|uniref:Urease accessory protein UreE n=1 Tax=Halospina denitrificans TaxID=332522 RepID=A0A4V3EP92_9GAMM|nr:urease accessory protein UreE [Halospina denitrificans]TDT37018.1 urease accessory protein [Halospina denitrificans]
MLELTERLDLADISEVFDTLTLPYEQRQRGRLRAATDAGRDAGLFLDRGPVLREGQYLRAATGEVVRIQAADEPVVTAHVTAGLPLARLCYHLGNRHVSLAIGEANNGEGWVRFPPDHVLEELAERLGARLEHHEAPFDPEPGAYNQAGHHQGHAHDHGHHHAH